MNIISVASKVHLGPPLQLAEGGPGQNELDTISAQTTYAFTFLAILATVLAKVVIWAFRAAIKVAT